MNIERDIIMRVITTTGQTEQRKLNSAKSKRSGKSAAIKEKKSPFLQILEEVLPPDDAQSYDLHALWSELPELEKNLINHPSDENLNSYRETVKNIAQATLKKNVHVKKLKRKNRRGETIELSVIKIIDDRLQKMAIMMHSRNNSAFSMLKAMEEIRGLLLDVKE